MCTWDFKIYHLYRNRNKQENRGKCLLKSELELSHRYHKPLNNILVVVFYNVCASTYIVFSLGSTLYYQSRFRNGTCKSFTKQPTKDCIIIPTSSERYHPFVRGSSHIFLYMQYHFLLFRQHKKFNLHLIELGRRLCALLWSTVLPAGTAIGLPEHKPTKELDNLIPVVFIAW